MVQLETPVLGRRKSINKHGLVKQITQDKSFTDYELINPQESLQDDDILRETEGEEGIGLPDHCLVGYNGSRA